MRILRRFKLYTICTLVILFVRLGLWMTKYQRIRSVLVRPCDADPQIQRKGTVIHTLRAVGRVARLVPDASCLTQTIAGQTLLSWKGIPTNINMGVMKDSEGTLNVHAWLVWNGVVVLQGDESTAKKFSKILDLPTPSKIQTADA
ncbi:lasso peptide biosynthesis B2 protein [Roseobacter sp.]|uniref:lasso peptide biosynthesis B2 protein n=1 Tax=Roseobacter sp. TaxID=1907202 RepID=UPI003859C154